MGAMINSYDSIQIKSKSRISFKLDFTDSSCVENNQTKA